MRLAIQEAKKGITKGQNPFGACIVRDSEVIGLAHNTVLGNINATLHAEINAIRMACKKLNSIDLNGCILYATTEPCPMCFGACHWAKLSKIIYGTRITDSKKAGFDELCISNDELNSLGRANLDITKDFLRNECLELFEIWSKKRNTQAI